MAVPYKLSYLEIETGLSPASTFKHTGDFLANRIIKYAGTADDILLADGTTTSLADLLTLDSLSAVTPLSYNNLTGAFSISQASASTNGYLSSTDWTSFNAKQGAITLTTSGTSGVSTLVGNTLNIPNYSTDLSGYVTLGTAQTISGAKTFSATINSSRISASATGEGAAVISAFAFDNSVAGSFRNNTTLGQNAPTLFVQQSGAGDIARFQSQTDQVSIESDGDVYGVRNLTLRESIKKITGSSTYTYDLPSANGTIALTTDLGNYVTLDTTQTITGAKTFTSQILTSSGSVTRLILSANGGENGLKNPVSGSNLYLAATSGTVTIKPSEGTVSSYTTFNSNGTVTFNGAITAPSLIRKGGTSSQFLKADGSVDSSAYITSAALANYATLDTNQTITGQKTFTADILANAITLDSTPATIPTAQGSMYFDADEQTVAAVLNGSTMKIGEDLFYQIKNQTGAIIPKGTALRFNGVVGSSGRVLAAPFLADGSVPSLYFLGVAYEDIPDGGDGKALAFGKVRGYNTNAYPAGTILYASTTVAGGYQTTTPLAPNNIIVVAAVVTQGVSNGTLLVRPTIGSNINNDEGVKIVTPVTGDLLQLQSNGLWENKSVSSLSLVPTVRTITINGNSYDLSANRTWDVGTITSLTGEALASGTGAVSVTLDNGAVIGKVLTGLNITGGTVNSTDSLLVALGKVQNQINGLIGGSILQGVWNATTNTPSLTSGVGTKGYYYIVNVAGTTNLDGITDWNIGDWAIYDGTAWQQVDNTDAVVTVNGYTGIVSLVTGDILEGAGTIAGRPSQLYFTEARSRASLSFASGSGAYNSSTGVMTIPTNTNELTNGANYITRAGLSANAPLSYNNIAGFFSIAQASGSQDGYLSSADWTTFNNKASAASLSAYVPYNGATTSLNLGTNSINAGTIFASSTGGGNTITAQSSIGNGVSISVTGPGAFGVNSSAPSGTAVSGSNDSSTRAAAIFSNTGGGDILNLNNIGGVIVRVTNAGNITGNSFIKSGGTSSQFLKADGSIDSNTYVTNTSLTGYVPYTGATANVNLGNNDFTARYGTFYNSLFIDSVSGGSYLTIKRPSVAFASGIIFQTNDDPEYRITLNSNDLIVSNLSAGNVLSILPTRQLKLDAYTSTSSFAGTPAGYLAFDTSGNILTVNAATGGAAIKSTQNFVATAGQTTFTIAGGYGVGLIDVYLNGIYLNSSDVTATNGTSIVLASAAVLGDTVDVVVFASVTEGVLADLVYVSGTQTITGAKTFGATIMSSQGINVDDAYGLYWKTDVSSFDPALAGIGQSSSGLDFYTNSSLSTPKLKILANGNTLIGTTTDAGYKLDVNGTGRFSGAYGTGAGLTISGTTYGTLATNRGASSASAGIGYFSVNSQKWFAGIYENSDNFGFYSVGLNGFPLTLNYSTGAATFSSSVTAKTTEAAEGISILGRSDDYSILRFKSAASVNKFTIYSNPNDLIFDNPTVGTAMIIKQGGNVGIGTASPGNKLDVRNTDIMQIRMGTDGGSRPYWQIGRDNMISGDFIIANEVSERMRITSGGNVLIGTTTDSGQKLVVNGTTYLSGVTTIGTTSNSYGSRLVVGSAESYTIESRRTGTGSEGHLVFQNANGAVGSIFTNGSSTSYNTSSDYRLKQDLKDFSGLSIINQIKTYDHEWKADKSRMYGVLAHELQAVVSYAVTGEKDGKEMQSVDYSKLVPIAIKGIQEHDVKINELQLLVMKLQTEIDTLKNIN